MQDAKFSGKKSASTEILLSCDFSVTLTLFFKVNISIKEMQRTEFGKEQRHFKRKMEVDYL